MSFINYKISEIVNSGQKAALCIIVSTQGSTPLKAGAKMVVFDDGRIMGTVGGGRLENACIDDALAVIKGQKCVLIKHNLKAQHEMCCGGSVDIYIEPLMQKKKMIMFGAGHIGKAVVKHMQDLDFDLLVVDPRKEIFEDWSETSYQKSIGPYADILPGLIIDTSTYVVIATYDHDTDREVLSYCIQQPHAYLGMIGSTKKIARTVEMFISDGVATRGQLEAVDMPVGIDIHAETADEIAISIVARLIQEKNKQ